jgi:hypothetical protein
MNTGRTKEDQSLVISMATNAYPTIAGGATRQYDQKIVRLTSRSKASVETACVICKSKARSMTELVRLAKRVPGLGLTPVAKRAEARC